MLIIAFHLGHNATVGLIHNGQIVGLLSQEKIDNIKNSATFPIQAAQKLIEECGLAWEDIAEVAISGTDIFPAHCYDYLFDAKNRIQSRLSPVGMAIKSLEKGPLGKLCTTALSGTQ